MSDPLVRLTAPRLAPVDGGRRQPLGRCLVEAGVITQDQLVRALKMQARLGAPIGEILVSEGWATPEDVMTALAGQFGLQIADFSAQPPDPVLTGGMPGDFWMRHRVIPWARLGPFVLVATARPDRFDAVADLLRENEIEAIAVLAPEARIMAALAERYAGELAEGASTRVPAEFSCRGWTPSNRLPLAALGLLGLGLLAGRPDVALVVLAVFSVVTLMLFATLKLSGFVSHVLSPSLLSAPHPAAAPAPVRLPKISMLVPLYREREIAGALVRRLGRLSYPKALLDVILVLEEHDTVTREALARSDLPPWMRVIEVPAHGGLTTKPRAMNYTLDFCRGDIVGVWDAEDAPVSDQLEQVAARFAAVDEDVVCLQGILDFYNPRTNWRARCFSIEYASWFRIVLPGIARMGLVVPLGGTTLFFRRDVLEELGGWDAHNVTEDADLGVRLCRAGYRTEMIETVTFEEANCRAWPWVKQRSRWLKGFMVTYLVHMRHPLRLLSDLGGWRFFGVQAFFLGTLGQFLLAPLIWSLWVSVFGLYHPIEAVLPGWMLAVMIKLFLGAEALNFAIGAVAVSAAQRRFLLPWVPTMMLYLPLGVLAAYKALYELVVRPFYWDKTQHGHAPAEKPGT
ncbi:glycosyltransferase [Seohaeicola saemankumensis]|nr:glycosyltransferase [Seohaeicola saemankumensis]MCA0869768.1 glycosyltransferase [Seohaeicola saemankumensis]